jgi:hypothetical protein
VEKDENRPRIGNARVDVIHQVSRSNRLPQAWYLGGAAKPLCHAGITRWRLSIRGHTASSCCSLAGTSPLSIEATNGFSRGGELDASRQNSSGSSSRDKIASSSFVAVMVSSACLWLANVPGWSRFLVR